MGRDIIFVEKGLSYPEQRILINTSCNAREDLQTHIERIKGGDTPCTQELYVTLENILDMIPEA